jgi:toxin-antitoxin system PIN domain toxin
VNLLDVNVWLAGIWDAHADHRAVVSWRARSDAPLVLCRITQMALLRHLTNPGVLGADAVTRRQAWNLIERQMRDPDVAWQSEPSGLDLAWRALSARDDRSHKLWTDDYLAGFAQAADLTLVTLERSFTRRYPSVQVEVIPPAS